jgi:hypothetical protein
MGCSSSTVKCLYFRRIPRVPSRNPDADQWVDNVNTRFSLYSIPDFIADHERLPHSLYRLNTTLKIEIIAVYEDNGNTAPDYNRPVAFNTRSQDFCTDSDDASKHPLWFLAKDDSVFIQRKRPITSSSCANGSNGGKVVD